VERTKIMKKAKLKKKILRLQRDRDYLEQQVDILCGTDLALIAIIKAGRLIQREINSQIWLGDGKNTKK